MLVNPLANSEKNQGKLPVARSHSNDNQTNILLKGTTKIKQNYFPMRLSNSSCRKVQGFNARPNPINAFQRSQSNHRQPFELLLFLIRTTSTTNFTFDFLSLLHPMWNYSKCFFNKIIIKQFIPLIKNPMWNSPPQYLYISTT